MSRMKYKYFKDSWTNEISVNENKIINLNPPIMEKSVLNVDLESQLSHRRKSHTHFSIKPILFLSLILLTIFNLIFFFEKIKFFRTYQDVLSSEVMENSHKTELYIEDRLDGQIEPNDPDYEVMIEETNDSF